MWFQPNKLDKIDKIVWKVKKKDMSILDYVTDFKNIKT